jgi:hypothetical protein
MCYFSPLPPKNPPRRNGHDWRGLQRCGNHLDIFVFPPRQQKAPRQSNRVSLSATPETMKHMPCGHLWRRCGNSERGVENLGQSTAQKWLPQEMNAHIKMT